MKRIPRTDSSVFRRAPVYADLTLVTRYGRPLGLWVPKPLIDKALTLLAPDATVDLEPRAVR